MNEELLKILEVEKKVMEVQNDLIKRGYIIRSDNIVKR